MHNDLVRKNLATIMNLLNYTQWDYELVGLAMLPSVLGSKLEIWIKENIMDYPVSVRQVDEIPSRLKGRARGGVPGKWEWLRSLIVNEMGPQALVKGKVTNVLSFPNKKEMQNAQSTCSAVHFHRKNTRNTRTSFDNVAYSVITRSDPLSGANGAYDLYVEVSFDATRKGGYRNSSV